MSIDQPCHVVAIVGGACAGSTAAELLAQSGCQVVVFDQNARPYGKIEDGLPRWHAKQREMEYRKIDQRLTHPNVTFVPLTRLGRDLDFRELAAEWGWSAVVLANGAWKDREVTSAAGAAEVEGRGLVYQNPFVYWFNHKEEVGYDGPRFEVLDGAVVLGGGLASIDVIKIIQLELYGRALRERGVEVSMHELEEQGIPKVCAAHGLDPQSFGIEGGLLCYRRRVEDMPLASPPPNASEKQLAKIAQVRQKLLQKMQDKFLFRFQPQVLAKRFLTDPDGHLRALELVRTEVAGKNVQEVAGSAFEVPTRLVISSIGSIPEPIPGVEMSGTYYRFKDWDTGEYAAIPGVFATGNVVTGQGNIKASVDHGRQVGQHLVERYLGAGAPGEGRDLTEATAAVAAKGEALAEAVAAELARKPPLPAPAAEALLARARARQREVGYDGDYAAWIAKVTPRGAE